MAPLPAQQMPMPVRLRISRLAQLTVIQLTRLLIVFDLCLRSSLDSHLLATNYSATRQVESYQKPSGVSPHHCSAIVQPFLSTEQRALLHSNSHNSRRDTQHVLVSQFQNVEKRAVTLR